MADPFPLYLPPEARRLFQSESLLRRLAQNAHWTDASRLLEVNGSLAGLALARALNCKLTVVEPDSKIADTLRERIRLAGLGEKVTLLNQTIVGSTFADGSFDGIMSLGRIPGGFEQLAGAWRPWLGTRGRLALTWIVKVSRAPNEASVNAWNSRLGVPIQTPRDTLLTMERVGYEPEMVETLGDQELDEYYREVETALAKAPTAEGADALRAELATHVAAGGKSGVTYGAVIGRRKEPGEKPPISRDAG